MKDNDNIAKLFKEKLSNHTEKVDPSVWKEVQANIGASAGAASTGAASLLTKVIIAVAAVTTICVVTYTAFNSAETTTEKEKSVLETTINKEDVSEKKNSTEKEVRLTEELPAKTNVSEQQQEIVTDFEPELPVSEKPPLVVLPDLSTLENNFEETITSPKENSKSTTDNNDTEEEDNYEYTPISLVVNVDIHKNQYVKLYATAQEADFIYWELGNGDTTSGEVVEYFYEEPGEYKIRVVASNADEAVTEYITINVEQTGKIIKLPNTFSPNNDGKNDQLSVESKGIIDFQITVLNNRQEVVYESNNPDFKWDGIHYRTNQKVAEGNYFYIIVAKDAVGNVINKHQKLSLFLH